MHKTIKYLHSWYTNEWELPLCFSTHIPLQFLKEIEDDFPLLGKGDITVEDIILYHTDPCPQGMMAVKIKMSPYLTTRLEHFYPEALI